jgi:Transposase DDE domain
MPVAVQAIMEGMPELADLHAVVHNGQTVLLVGNVALASYGNDDTGMRNLAVVTLTQLGFTGVRVAQLVGLTPEYVSQLRGNARRHGSAGLVRRRGRPGKLSSEQVRQARAWKAAGVSDAEIARRLAVSHKTATKAVAGVPPTTQPVLDLPDAAAEVEATVAAQQPVSDGPDAAVEVSTPQQPSVGWTPAAARPTAAVQPTPVQPTPASTLAAGADDGAGLVPVVEAGTARIGVGRFDTRYAGAALLYAFTDRVAATDVFAQAIGAAPRAVAALRSRRFDDVAVLTAVTTVFGLGFASLEQAKHPDRAQVGPVAGIEVLPELRTLRPRLAAIADQCDPLALQRSFAQAMLAGEPCQTGLYFIDEHFMPYAGALPVGKGWNTKRRHAEPGRVDTLVADAHGRAICFTSGEPSGLSTSLPPVLAQLRAIVGPTAQVTVAFDRGGSYPTVFTACRTADVHWLTYRRGKPVATTAERVTTTVRRNGKDTPVHYADETVHITDYGTARQLTLFDADTPVLQILTSDTTSDAATLIMFLRARWGIENLFKYLDFYGIDYLADYHATIETNTRKINNPERKQLRGQLTALVADRDQHRERIGALHTDRTITITALNRESVAAQDRIHALDKQIDELTQRLKTVPAKLPANLIDPDATRAVHRTARRALQMVLRLLAANAEHWLAHHLNAYLQDPDEYRATTRNLLHLGGTITYTDTTIHIALDPPNTPRLTHALTLLLDEINHTPPHLPGDPRPLTYSIKPRST